MSLKSNPGLKQSLSAEVIRLFKNVDFSFDINKLLDPITDTPSVNDSFAKAFSSLVKATIAMVVLVSRTNLTLIESDILHTLLFFVEIE